MPVPLQLVPDNVEDCSAIWQIALLTDPEHVVPLSRCDETATVWALAMEELDDIGALPWDLALLMEQIREPEMGEL